MNVSQLGNSSAQLFFARNNELSLNNEKNHWQLLQIDEISKNKNLGKK